MKKPASIVQNVANRSVKIVPRGLGVFAILVMMVNELCGCS